MTVVIYGRVYDRPWVWDHGCLFTIHSQSNQASQPLCLFCHYCFNEAWKWLACSPWVCVCVCVWDEECQMSFAVCQTDSPIRRGGGLVHWSSSGRTIKSSSCSHIISFSLSLCETLQWVLMQWHHKVLRHLNHS